MKRLLLPLALITLLLSGCEKVPYADFISSSTSVQPMDIINFRNTSNNATEFDWDFGDGYSSSNFSPSHYYENEGTYTVTLTAHGNGKVSVARATIDVYYTVLRITVAEWNQDLVHNNLIAGASVILYPSLADWDNETNKIVEGITDNSGIVDFLGLDPQTYYVDAWTPSYNNWQLGSDDEGWIAAGPLVPFVTNNFTAWVDYAPTSAQRSKKNIETPKINVPKRTYIKVDVSK